eukprot:jgi/Psemu1/312193/fgenesh1_kg.896_\
MQMVPFRSHCRLYRMYPMRLSATELIDHRHLLLATSFETEEMDDFAGMTVPP